MRHPPSQAGVATAESDTDPTGIVDDPEKVLPIFAEIGAIADRAEGRKITMAALDRFAFYAAARRAYAIARTSDPGPYGCFIFRKGVI